MTSVQKEKVKLMRGQGYSYSKIAITLNISENTIKAFCRRNNLGGVKGKEIKYEDLKDNMCKKCGTMLGITNKGPRKKFCSDNCRRQWWKENDQLIDKKAYYKAVCTQCGNMFKSYGNKNRKYCSHNCYIKKRFGKGDRENE